jgi:ribonuclease VapC
MILDTSALVAILYREPEAADFVERIRAAEACQISVANYVELSMVVESQLGPDGMRQAEAFFRRAGIIVEPVTIEHGELARQASSISARGTTKPD